MHADPLHASKIIGIHFPYDIEVISCYLAALDTNQVSTLNLAPLALLRCVAIGFDVAALSLRATRVN